MKKTISILWLLTTILLFGVSCSNSTQTSTADTSNTDHPLSEYSVRIYGFSDSISSADHSVEYSFADSEKYEGIIPSVKKEFLIGNKSYSASYDKVAYLAYNYFPVYEYGDSEGNSFSVDDTGKLTSCFFRKEESDIVVSKEDCLQIAKRFLQNIIDVSQYEIEITENGDEKYYTIEFTKYIGDIKTTDSATIKVLYDGNIYSYSSFMLGRIPKKTNVSTLNFEQVHLAIENKLDQIYKDVRNTYDKVKYDTSDLMLTVLKDGKIGLICYTNISCINTAGEYDVVLSERISMVVSVN